MELLYIVLGLVLLFGFFILNKQEQTKVKFIDEYNYPSSIKKMLSSIYPKMNNKEQKFVIEGLKEYFKLYVLVSRRMIAVPSRSIDRAWFEFMQNEEEYSNFCKKAFGFYLHRAPISEMNDKNLINNDLKIVWTLACTKEDIDPDKPDRIPFIFCLDSRLNIDDGFKYSLDDTFNNVNNIGSLKIQISYRSI